MEDEDLRLVEGSPSLRRDPARLSGGRIAEARCRTDARPRPPDAAARVARRAAATAAAGERRASAAAARRLATLELTRCCEEGQRPQRSDDHPGDDDAEGLGASPDVCLKSVAAEDDMDMPIRPVGMCAGLVLS
ncbi:hypothetical protein HPB47_001930 [Ixodes persulcatus]|uniref:Uncharacterized protein n=1 Tax=Ixodes persulcatus TaxID=34615 RepID=A0AC60R073_IXOPE|nr:hypothetical protein HPB47_001930 [Ixodes persulcatus]